LSVAADVSALNVAYFRELKDFFFTCNLVHCLVNIGLPVISFTKHACCLMPILVETLTLATYCKCWSIFKFATKYYYSMGLSLNEDRISHFDAIQCWTDYQTDGQTDRDHEQNAAGQNISEIN